jgi:hypothetical protein
LGDAIVGSVVAAIEANRNCLLLSAIVV